jgi:hypothetical protein
MAPFWPVELKHNNIVLRPLGFRDRRAWLKIRENNKNWDLGSRNQGIKDRFYNWSFEST